MTLVRALRILIALALLNAQHAALAHQIWHLGDHATLPAQSQLCDHRQALGAVAGAVDCPIVQASDEAMPFPLSFHSASRGHDARANAVLPGSPDSSLR
jgi:hypothetical protein